LPDSRHIFIPKIPIWGPWKALICMHILWSFGTLSVIWNIAWLFGICYGHLVYVMAIRYFLWPFSIFWGHLVYFYPFWYVVPRKNLATLPRENLDTIKARQPVL
jgi:hypothetical protein